MAGSRFSRLLRGLPVWRDRGFHACCVDFRYGRIEVFTLAAWTSGMGRIEVFTLAAWTSGMAGSRFSRLLRGLPVWPDRGFHACSVDFRYGRIEVFTLAAWTSGMAGSRFSRLLRGLPVWPDRGFHAWCVVALASSVWRKLAACTIFALAIQSMMLLRQIDCVSTSLSMFVPVCFCLLSVCRLSHSPLPALSLSLSLSPPSPPPPPSLSVSASVGLCLRRSLPLCPCLYQSVSVCVCL